jgi:nitrate/TMAO reductase-like tetraheme cytochrome c subunit
MRLIIIKQNTEDNMTLIKQESHLLTCDSCGYEMQIDGKYKDPQKWYVEYKLLENVKHYCPDCHIVDEHDKVIIRKKEDNNE